MNNNLVKVLKGLENHNKAYRVAKYMQALPEQNSYALGDIFVGISVPESRKFVKQYQDQITNQDWEELITSPIHEYRFIATVILIQQFKKAKKTPGLQEQFYNRYLEFLPYINHWDLVDLSAPSILGSYLYSQNNQDLDILKRLAESPIFWQQRIAIVSTLYFIKQDLFQPSFDIIKLLFYKNHIMVQKAVGWMIKEIGKIDIDVSIHFVRENLKDIHPQALLMAKEWYPADIKKELKPLRSQH